VTASYPTQVKPFLAKVDFSDTVLAEHVNSLQEEVTAIASNLGTSIRTNSGWVGEFDQVTITWDTLKDRLVNIEYGLGKIYGDFVSLSGGSVITSSGTSVVGLTVKAASSQTANIATFKNSSNSEVTYVSASGHIFTRSKELVPVIYASTQPTGSSFAAGTIWVDSSVDVDISTTAVASSTFNETFMLMGA
jgi:hypothetical protein